MPKAVRRGYIADALKVPRIYFICTDDQQAEEILTKEKVNDGM